MQVSKLQLNCFSERDPLEQYPSQSLLYINDILDTL